MYRIFSEDKPRIVEEDKDARARRMEKKRKLSECLNLKLKQKRPPSGGSSSGDEGNHDKKLSSCM